MKTLKSSEKLSGSALGTQVSASNLQVSLNLNYRKIVEVFSFKFILILDNILQ
jgi:hypothetical protein